MKSITLLIGFVFFIGNFFAQTVVSTVVDTSAYRFTDDLIFDDSGNLYCADYSGDAIYKRTPGGTVTVFASGMNTPNGMAFDSAGNLFICDNIGNAIYKLSSTGVYLDTFPVTYPSGLIKDAQSDTMIFTTYGAQSHLKKLAPDGSIINFHSGNPLNGPVGLEYFQGELYVANFTDREIYRVEDDTLIFIIQLPGSGSLGFIATVGDKLLATAMGNHKIYSVDPILETVELLAGSAAGHVNGGLDTCRFTTPNGIVANAAGDTVYISEYNTRRLRMITGYALNTDELYKSLELEVYPNPVTEVVNLRMKDGVLPSSISIVDLEGNVVLQLESIPESHVKLDVSGFAPGTYMLVVESEEYTVGLERILKVE